MSEYLDEDGYPTEEALEVIKSWRDWDNIEDLFVFMKSIWWSPDWGWHEEDGFDDIFPKKAVKRYCISTGGWSGNESIIAAFQGNWVIWHSTWVQSRRGGHYIFERKLPND